MDEKSKNPQSSDEMAKAWLERLSKIDTSIKQETFGELDLDQENKVINPMIVKLDKEIAKTNTLRQKALLEGKISEHDNLDKLYRELIAKRAREQ